MLRGASLSLPLGVFPVQERVNGPLHRQFTAFPSLQRWKVRRNSPYFFTAMKRVPGDPLYFVSTMKRVQGVSFYFVNEKSSRCFVQLPLSDKKSPRWLVPLRHRDEKSPMWFISAMKIVRGGSFYFLTVMKIVPGGSFQRWKESEVVRFSDEKSPRWFVLLRSEEAHWPKNVEENVQMISLPGFQRLFCQQLCNRHLLVNSCATKTLVSQQLCNKDCSVNSCATKTHFCLKLEILSAKLRWFAL